VRPAELVQAPPVTVPNGSLEPVAHSVIDALEDPCER
jgi:hypothetical protein